MLLVMLWSAVLPVRGWWRGEGGSAAGRDVGFFGVGGQPEVGAAGGVALGVCEVLRSGRATGGSKPVPSCTSCCRAVTICKRFGAMWVMFPWINANVMHPWLHSSPRQLGALGWSFPVWVHLVVCHSGAHLQRWGNFIKFSSIPTEWRNKGFKMDIRHCFQGWKLSKPYVTRWGLRHALHLDALDWGTRLWFGEKGLGREAIKFGMQRMRKKHRAPKHM